jgi:hypothetical protein
VSHILVKYLKMTFLLKPKSNFKKLDQLILDTVLVSCVTYDLSGGFTHPQELARNTVKERKKVSVNRIFVRHFCLE